MIHHEKNRGVAAARNTTFDNAKGDFIMMVDADDWLELNAVELLVEKQKETGADLVSGWAKMVYKDHVEEIREPLSQTKDEAVRLRLVDGWNNVIWGRLIRRSILEDNHIRALEGCDMGDDKYLSPLIFYYANSFAVCESYLYNYECRN
ncbi:MAG: glycosyltransferase family 2 protein, partial [Bacteroidales bacterium]|nr:glycosyltransferase family 2 protein [Bacteroidales bacterium]